LAAWLPTLTALVVTGLAVAVMRLVLGRRAGTEAKHSLGFQIQVWTIGIVALGVVMAVLLLPDQTDGNLVFSALGLVVTGALALSGQSIIANGMAGAMLRMIKNFRPGDFIEVGDHTGRVSEMGLFHTEIQSPERDLITMPNLLMINQPVRVVRSSGTIVSVQVGLGYDLPRHLVKELFVKAALAADLEDPYVQVVELGDHSVTYRVAGFLTDATRVLSARSWLREAVLDTFSEADVEIVSPTYVARRAISSEPLIPDTVEPNPDLEEGLTAEDLMFDKAELAADAENLRELLTEKTDTVDSFRQLLLTQSGDEAERTRVQLELATSEVTRLTEQICQLEDDHENQD